MKRRSFMRALTGAEPMCRLGRDHEPGDVGRCGGHAVICLAEPRMWIRVQGEEHTINLTGLSVVDQEGPAVYY
jgi:hypothetical protein